MDKVDSLKMPHSRWFPSMAPSPSPSPTVPSTIGPAAGEKPMTGLQSKQPHHQISSVQVWAWVPLSSKFSIVIL